MRPNNCVLCLGVLLLGIPVAVAQPRQRIYLETAARVAASVDEYQILDVRTKEEFLSGHMAGARWLDDALWMQKSMQNLNDLAFWQEQLRSLGLERSQPTLVIGDSLPSTARAWWLLKYFGMADVRLLDGGYAAWTKGGFPVSQEELAVAPSTIQVELQAERSATLEDVVANLQSSASCQILDNRSKAEFTGQRGVGRRLGHLPGAVHLEWKEFLDEEGMFLKPEAMQALVAKSGIDLDAPITAHCQTGGRSSVAAFALEMLGATKVKNYYLGWSEYSEVLTAPVETEQE